MVANMGRNATLNIDVLIYEGWCTIPEASTKKIAVKTMH